MRSTWRRTAATTASPSAMRTIGWPSRTAGYPSTESYFQINVEGALNEGATVTTSSRQMKVLVEPVREMAMVSVEAEVSHGGKGSDSKGSIMAPMPGKIISIKVKPGDTVAQNQIVAVLEAMKMENEIQSDVAGTVLSVSVRPGETVEGGQVLLVVQ